MKDTTLRPLCISLWSPPVVRPQAILLGKMLPEWIAQGVTPILVTFEDCRGWDIDIPKYYIPQHRLSKIISKIPFLRDVDEEKYLKKIVDIIASIIQKHDCNIIYSFAKPHDSNVIGAMLKERLGIPFVAHFSDPWYENLFSGRFFRRKKKILRLEKYVIEKCDRVNFIVKEMKDTVMHKYPVALQEKARVIHHFFQPKDYPLRETYTRNNSVFTLSHIGILRKQRNPEMLFQAIRLLQKKHLPAHVSFRIQLIGSLNDYTAYSEEELRSLVTTYNLADVVDIIPTVSFEESLRYMMHSDCLVVIDANIPNAGHVLSKAIDYLGSGTPIVGIMPHDNPTADVILTAGYQSFDYTQGEALATYIDGLISGIIVPTRNEEYIRQFHVDYTTTQLLNEFRELI